MSGPIQPPGLRPYSSPSTAGATPRSQEFNTGITGDDPGNSPTALGQDSLNLNSQQFNDQVPHGIRADSVLTPIGSNPGGIGMSAADASRRLPDGTYLGSIDGTSADSFEPSAMLHLTTGLNTGLDSQ